MSLYRQPGRVASRNVALAAAAALVVGIAGGFALGRSTAPDPTLADRIAEVRDSLQPARQAVEIAPTEYAQAVRGGRVVRQAEYAGVRSTVERAVRSVGEAEDDLEALDPERAKALAKAVGALESAVDRKAEPSEVDGLSRTAGDALEAAAGGSGPPTSTP